MNQYRLTPKNLADPMWRFSKNRSEIIVEAPDETEARKIAALQNMEFTEVELGPGVNPSSPWEDSQLSDCSLV